MQSRTEKQKEFYRKLYPFEDPELLLAKDRKRLGRRAMLLGLGSLVLGGSLAFLEYHNSPILSLERPPYQGEAREELLLFSGEDASATEVTVTVTPMRPTEKEREELFEDAYEELMLQLPGNNASIDSVSEPLLMQTTALDGLIQAEWVSMTPELLSGFGEIMKPQEDISPEGEKAKLALTLTGFGEVREYEISLRILPGKQTAAQQAEKMLQEVMEQSPEEKRVVLPKELNGEVITWYSGKQKISWSYVLLFPIAGFLWLLASEHGKQESALKKREQELYADYGRLLSEFTVLIQAGMTPINAWTRVAEGYEKRKKQGEGSRYVYEEMVLTLRRIKNGYPERKSYQEFARRTGLKEYLRFVSLLEQSRKQGTIKLSERLLEEVQTAFSARKLRARELGEEAQSKLMIPMIMNLCIVFVVVMVPAFMSFG